MTFEQIFISFWTLLRKEITRFMRIWKQTLVPSAITSVLYFVIFGTFIGSQIKPIQGFTYMQFIVPGLVMMAVITNAFTNTVSSFYSSKFQRSIEEILVSPMPTAAIISAYAAGGTTRGILVGLIVLGISLFFTHLTVHSAALIVLFIVLTAILFSLAGLLNGIFAQSFDDISIVPAFVLTPLTYLGGVFYSISVLPQFWQVVSKFNPILYMINGFRYGFLGFSDVGIGESMAVVVLFIIIFLAMDWVLIKKGYGLRS